MAKSKADHAEARKAKTIRLNREHTVDQTKYQLAVYAARLMPGDLADVGIETIEGCRRAIVKAELLLGQIEARLLEQQS